MTKAELIAALVQDRPHLDKKDAQKIVSSIFDQITAALAQGQRVELRDFGNFTVRHRDARDGRNPRTGGAVAVAPKKIPFFKAGQKLRQRVDMPHAHSGRKAKTTKDKMDE